jgi:hypothetical protein
MSQYTISFDLKINKIIMINNSCFDLYDIYNHVINQNTDLLNNPISEKDRKKIEEEFLREENEHINQIRYSGDSWYYKNLTLKEKANKKIALSVQ